MWFLFLSSPSASTELLYRDLSALLISSTKPNCKMRLVQILRWSLMLPSLVFSAPHQVRDLGSFVDSINLDKDVPILPDYRFHDCLKEQKNTIRDTMEDVYQLLAAAMHATDDRLRPDSVIDITLADRPVNFTSAQADVLLDRWFGKAPNPSNKYGASRKKAVKRQLSVNLTLTPMLTNLYRRLRPIPANLRIFLRRVRMRSRRPLRIPGCKHHHRRSHRRHLLHASRTSTRNTTPSAGILERCDFGGDAEAQ